MVNVQNGGRGKADLHIHTAFSDGMAEASALLDYVESETDLDVIAITDHDDIRGAWQAREVWAKGRYRFDLIVGMEVTALEGHLVALYLEEPVTALKRAHKILDEVHRQGGLCVIAHPMSRLTRSLDRRTIERLAAANPGAHFDGIEAAHRSLLFATWCRSGAELNKTLGVAEIASSDAHFLPVIGRAHTEFAGRTGADLKQAVLDRTTRAVTGTPATLAEIGFAQVMRQSWRGFTATPRAMGWGPTAYSFVRRMFRLP